MTAIIKYNAGNIQSVLMALERLGEKAIWTDDPDQIRSADRVIFPGVGEAASAMQYLTAHGLDTVLCTLKQPVLGICLGLQLFCRHSAENDTTCLGVFDTSIRRFHAPDLKVPHMGWNQIGDLKGPLFEGVSAGAYVYFVHSFYAPLSTDTIATCEYGDTFSAGMQKDNYYTLQFHPEKSGVVGQRILSNFLAI